MHFGRIGLPGFTASLDENQLLRHFDCETLPARLNAGNDLFKPIQWSE